MFEQRKKKQDIEIINPTKALMVWAAIINNGKSEIFVNEWNQHLNQDSYIEILEKKLIPFADKNYDGNEEWIFL